MPKPTIGTLISGTLNPSDLLPAFADELERIMTKPGDDATRDEMRAYRERERLIKEARAYALVMEEEGALSPHGEECASEVVCELQEALDEEAKRHLPYFYFGNTEGDGSDFGFWFMGWDSFRDCFEGLHVKDTSEVPDDYSGEVCFVNDHGNITLYVADKGELTEIWAIV